MQTDDERIASLTTMFRLGGQDADQAEASARAHVLRDPADDRRNQPAGNFLPSPAESSEAVNRLLNGDTQLRSPAQGVYARLPGVIFRK